MDVDIDFKNREDILKLVEHYVPSRRNNHELVKHNVGVYFQEIPLDDETGLASIPYEEAEKLGWIKIDFLNNSIYEKVKNEKHLNELIDRDVPWELFKERLVVEKLAHISNHYDIVEQHLPSNLEQLAMILALIRPGKRHLVGKTWTDIEKEIWIDDGKGYSFKRSHAISYALSIVVQLQLLIDELVEEVKPS